LAQSGHAGGAIIEAKFIPFSHTLYRDVKEVAVAQLNEKQLRPGFFQSAPGQVTLLIATMVVMLIFAWSYI
jgi:hypothetical protein